MCEKNKEIMCVKSCGDVVCVCACMHTCVCVCVFDDTLVVNCLFTGL